MKKSTIINWGFIQFLTVFSFCFSSSCAASIPLSSIFHEPYPDPDSKPFINCIQSFPNTNETHVPVTFTPSNSSFQPIWLFSANNLRFVNNYTRKPSIIVTPFNAKQVQIALYCTKQQGYEIRIRSGGHDFEAISYTANAPFVMFDFYNMRNIEIDVDNQTAWVETGAVLGELYYAISQKTDKLFFTGGVWPMVGLGGFISGGGCGNLMRKYGLGADNVLDVRFIDVNGNILDRNSMGEDLFWAIRGGGASSFGIVLAWKLRLVPVPERITIFTVTKTLEENATEIFYKYQFVAPSIDRNLVLRLQITPVNIPKKTVQVSFHGIYQGTTDTLLLLLDEKFPDLGVTKEICDQVRIVQSYLLFANYDITTPVSILANRSAFLRISYKGKSDYVREAIPIEGIEAIFKKFLEDDGLAGEVSIIPFGGRMNDISETAIPYPHRAGVLYQIYESTSLATGSNSAVTNMKRLKWLNELYDIFKPYVSKSPREAYVNYIDLELGVGNRTYKEASEWGERYWKKANFKRLIRIKARVDPENFFRHPQSIPLFSKSLSDI